MANAFDLTAIIKLDDAQFKAGLKNVGKVLSVFGKAAGAALGAAATGVAALTKSAVSAYGEFEQLEGGIKKLYGNMGLHAAEYAEQQGKSLAEVSHEWAQLEQAQNLVLKNAEAAYATAGMSMNTYMETATQFSASLINSLGGDSLKAAELTDVAMRSISDNWNTFGGDLDAISNAYKGFSKQNYNMLDNLKLGYGGSRKEMERLIADANEYASAIGEASDLSIENFSDIVTAIDLVQQKQNIAGTTTREAATTIQGSLNMTKSAWQNLMVAIGDSDADLSKYFEALVSSAETAFGNIIPVAEQALIGLGDLISRAAPIIIKRLPGLVSELLPSLLSAATSLVSSLVEAIPGLLDALWNAIVQVATEIGGEEFGGALSGLGETVRGVIESIAEALPEIDFQAVFDGAADIINGVADAISFCVEHFSEIETVAVAAGVALSGLWLIFNAGTIVSTVTGFIQKASVAFKAFNAVLAANPIALVITLIASLVAAFITAYNTNEEFRAKVDAAWKAIKDTAVNVFTAVRDFVVNTWNSIVSGVTSAVNSVKSAVTTAFNAVKNTATSIWSNISSSISNAIESARDKVKSAIDKIRSFFNFSWSLPPLKLPHFSITGAFSLNPPSVPKISVAWNRKALSEPFMFSDATLFGAGEAGDEVLYGKSHLMDDIRDATAESNDVLAVKIDAILAVLQEYLPETAKKELFLDSDLLVGGIRSKMDNQLGELDGYGRRGVSIA